jgi:hypothetical protein
MLNIIAEITQNFLFDNSFCPSTIEEYLAEPAPGSDPHPLFDGRYYLSRYPDVSESGVNPLFHYMSHGASEFRDPNPFFDTAYYVQGNPECMQSGLTPLGHFIAVGAKSGVRPHPFFDCTYYNACYADVQSSGLDPLSHFLRIGRHEKRRPCAEFDPLSYLRLYPDVAAAKSNPAEHYIHSGKLEGRSLTEVSLIDEEEYSKLRSLEWQLLPFSSSTDWVESRLPRRDAAGRTYLELVNLIREPFQILVLCNNLNAIETRIIESIREKSKNRQLTTITDSLRGSPSEAIYLREIEPTLSEAEIEWLLLKLIVQTRPEMIYDISTGYMCKLLKVYHQQLTMHSKTHLRIIDYKPGADGILANKWASNFNAALDSLEEVVIPDSTILAKLKSHFGFSEADSRKFTVSSLN